MFLPAGNPIPEAEDAEEDIQLLGSAKPTGAAVPRTGEQPQPRCTGRAGCRVALPRALCQSTRRLIHHLIPELAPLWERLPARPILARAHQMISAGTGSCPGDTDWDKGRAQGSACSGSQLPSLHRAFTNPTDPLTHTQTRATLHGVLHPAHGNTVL